jgi:hypothetical protein
MFKIKAALAAALVAAPVIWAGASLVSNRAAEQAEPATADQVDTFQLMSASQRLPMHSYAAY